MSPPQTKRVDRRRAPTRRQRPQPRPLWRRPWFLASGGALALGLLIAVMVWVARPDAGSDWPSPAGSLGTTVAQTTSAPGRTPGGLPSDAAHVFYGST